MVIRLFSNKKMFVSVIFFLVLCNFIVSQDSENQHHAIGAIIYENSDLKSALEISATKYNFEIHIEELSTQGVFYDVREKVCLLVERSVIGIIDGVGGRASEYIQALSDTIEIPHVAIQHSDLYNKNWSMLNLYPSPSVYNSVLENLIIKKSWDNFTVLYVKGYTISRVVNLFDMEYDSDSPTVSVRELSGDDYRDVLINARENGYTNFVVDCPSKYLEQLLKHGQEVALMADEHSYIILSPDLFTLDLSRYRYGGVNMTGFRLISLKQNELLWEFTEKLNNETGQNFEPHQIKNKILLAHDAVLVFAEAVNKLKINNDRKITCDGSETWLYGSSLLSFMRTNKVLGITGILLFDGYGQRDNVEFDLLELTPADNQTIGTWKGNELTVSWPPTPPVDVSAETIMRNKTFIVLIAESPPYGYKKNSVTELDGNDRYEGFTVDLIDRLSEMLGFNYQFKVENDYGSLKDGKWTGMVQQLREDRADFGICDFTITVERQSAIDFSMPFMTLGIGILYKEPSKQPPEMFSFMAVFSKEVWYYMVLVQVGLGAVMIFVGRISHKEWQNPVPCIEEPEELNNQFSFANSMWLIIGSVMQQGSEIAPIAVAPRMITSVWWFFTMVMVASYTGTLVAFLTVEKNVLPFQNAAELVNQKSIRFGSKKQGSTRKFFEESKDPVYMAINERMKANPNWCPDSNDKGVEIAERESYAFFMESTSLEYYKQRHCDLLQVGGLLDSKSYGIGMKKESIYKSYIDDALLKLKERGEIQKLKDIWWKEKRGGGKCEDATNEEPKQLGMKNMLGAFVVLGGGCLVGLLISTLDMMWGVFKRSVKYGTTFKYELVEELKFAIKFSGDVKPVKRGQKNLEGSSEALAVAEGKDELRSLRSLRSGRSTDTHRTQHSHSSKHSSSGLSVAFAKRREYI